MRSKGSRFTLGVWGLRVCSLDVAQPFATVRNRSQLFARSPYGRAYGKFCKRGHFWRFHMWRCFVSCGRRGTSCHSDVFCNASKVVLCGRRNTFATFSEDVLQFSWQAQHFGGVHRHFAWQAQHFRRVVLRDFCKSHWQGGVKWRQGASVMKIDGSLARNIDFEVANFQVLRKTRRNTSIATKCENWRMSRRKCSFWCSHVSRLESLVFLWPRRVYGGSCKTYPFRRFPSRLPVVLRGKRGTLWHSNLVDNSTFYTLHFTLHTPHFALHTLHSTLYTLHSTLHTLHSTLYTPHFTLHALHLTLYTLHFTLYTPHSTLYTQYFTLYTPHSTLHTLHSTLHTLHSTLHTSHLTLHPPHSALYTPHSALCIPHFTLYTLHSTLYTLHFTLRTLHCTLHTPHFTLNTLHFTLYTPHSSLHTLHSTLHTLHSTLHTSHFTLDTPPSTLCTLHSTLRTLHSTLHTLHSTLYTSDSTLYTLHSTLYTLHSTLYTPHSTLHTLPLYTPHFSLRTLHSFTSMMFPYLRVSESVPLSYVWAFGFVGCILFFKHHFATTSKSVVAMRVITTCDHLVGPMPSHRKYSIWHRLEVLAWCFIRLQRGFIIVPPQQNELNSGNQAAHITCLVILRICIHRFLGVGILFISPVSWSLFTKICGDWVRSCQIMDGFKVV